MIKTPFLAMVIALGLALVLTPLVRKLAISLNLVDQPGGRRINRRPTPRGGGLAIYLGFMVAVLVTFAVHPRLHLDIQTMGVLICGTLMAFIGFLDDKLELSAKVQLLGIVVAAVVLSAVFGIRVNYVTDPFHPGKLIVFSEIVAIGVTVLWVFGVTKTMDLIDGLDGLAAGICAIAAGTLLVMAWQARPGSNELAPYFTKVAVMSGALLGASLGFLRFNYPPAKIFMGTIGAQFMGFVLASISIIGAFKLATLFAVAVPVLALGVPIFDAVFVVLKRFIDRRPVHEADTTHVHHRLLNRGLSHSQTLVIILLLAGLLSAAGLVLFLTGR